MGFTKLIGVRQNTIFEKGGGRVRQFLFFSYKGGRGGKPISDYWLTRGGGGVLTPLFLADILCQQPLAGEQIGIAAQTACDEPSL